LTKRTRLSRPSETALPGLTLRHGLSWALTSLSRVIRTQPHAGGWLEIVCGPMFSGKSEELIRRLRRAEIAGQRALIVKPLIDDRYDVGHVVSHAGAKMRAVTASSSREVRRLAGGYDAVGIDCVAEFVDKLEAVCHRCGGPATMTQRLVDGEPAPFDGETIQVGALDSYEARCRACHSVSKCAISERAAL
jgi:thymidine kinase